MRRLLALWMNAVVRVQDENKSMMAKMRKEEEQALPSRCDSMGD